MRDAFTFSLFWTLAVGLVAGVPLSVVIALSLVRSGESPAERRARELHWLLLEEEVNGERCLGCRTPVEPDWLSCPVCASALRARCHECGKTLKLHWSACPWCAADLRTVNRPRVGDELVDEVGAAAA